MESFGYIYCRVCEFPYKFLVVYWSSVRVFPYKVLVVYAS
jgi:hypothetical protein